ncbi:hypothetical protein [Sedimentitalea arenosa]|uniref:Lipoprotein n=1 Tax=Sedimentitalea arenosa TaxID=2798803 RepID=A0A8J7IKE8_9RHOB|nr:hypothetical protein [Arenibacterium arenosum]MBJ6373547.1 hypothetical protein [Arenibacterium arenosum]
MAVPKLVVAGLVAATALAGCVEDTGSTASSGAPTAAQQSCLRDVSRTTGNPDVVVLGSEFSEAGTLVRVGVGPDRAPWQCIAYRDGTTAGIQSLVDEGFL